MEFQLSYFKYWIDAVKVLHSIRQQIWKTQQWSQDGERSVFIPIPKKGNAKECSNYCTITLISHTNKVKAQNSPSLASTVCELWTAKCSTDLEKAEEPEIKLPTSADHQKSKRIPEKHLFLLYWLCQSLWLCGSQETVENSERDGNTRPPYLSPEKFVCRSRSNS